MRRSVRRSTRAFKCSSFGSVSNALMFYRTRSCFISLTLAFTLMLVETFGASTSFHFRGASKRSSFCARARRLSDASKCSLLGKCVEVFAVRRARLSVRRSAGYRTRSGFTEHDQVYFDNINVYFNVSRNVLRVDIISFLRCVWAFVVSRARAPVCQMRRSVRLLASASKCSSFDARV